MDEQKMQELNLEEMDKISGGADNNAQCKFSELSPTDQQCIRYGYCPKCGPEYKVQKVPMYYKCDHCGLCVQATSVR